MEEMKSLKSFSDNPLTFKVIIIGDSGTLMLIKGLARLL